MSETEAFAIVVDAADKATKRNANVRYIFKNAVLPGLVLGTVAIIAIAVADRSKK